MQPLLGSYSWPAAASIDFHTMQHKQQVTVDYESGGKRLVVL